MNFIARNLGWLLLLAFFIFMLFVISSNNGGDVKDNQTGAILTGSATQQQDNLDDLVSKIESEEKMAEEENTESKDVVEKKRGIFNRLFGFNDSDNIEGEEKNIEDGDRVSEDTAEKKRGLFAWIFGSDKNNKDSNSSDNIEGAGDALASDEENMNKESIEDEVKTNEEDDDTEEDEDGFFSRLFGSDDENTTASGEVVKASEDENAGVDEKDSDIVVLKGGNIMKKSGGETGKISYKFAPEVGAYNNQYDSTLPGVNLNTKVGNEYEVGVSALKLNNANFTQTLAYLARGDVLKQLSTENIYGCFMVEIIDAKNLSNVGKKGYVCKKWLTNVSQDDIKVIAAPSDDIEPQSMTKIGDIITLEDNITIDGVKLNAGDKVDQLSESDDNGCATVLVCESENAFSLGKVIKYCSKS